MRTRLNRRISSDPIVTVESRGLEPSWRWLLPAAALAALGCSDPAGQAQPTPSGGPTISIASDAPSAAASGAASASASGAASADASAPVPSDAAALSAEQAVERAQQGVLPAGLADQVAPAGKPQVRVLDAGGEPRSKLRYALSSGDQYQLAMSMGMNVTMKAQGRSLPGGQTPVVTMILDVGVGDVTDQAAALTAELLSVEFGAQSEQEKLALAPIQQRFDALRGLEVSYMASPVGAVASVDVKLPPGAPPDAQQALGQMRQSFESMMAPLPEEPVGVGATWEVVSRVQTGGADLVQWSTMKLVDKKGDELNLDVSVEQLAATAEVNAPGMPPGAAAKLAKLSSKGKGKSRVDLKEAVPLEGTMRLETGMGIAMSQGGIAVQDATMDVDTVIQLNFQRPTAAAAPKPQ